MVSDFDNINRTQLVLVIFRRDAGPCGWFCGLVLMLAWFKSVEDGRSTLDELNCDKDHVNPGDLSLWSVRCSVLILFRSKNLGCHSYAPKNGISSLQFTSTRLNVGSLFPRNLLSSNLDFVYTRKEGFVFSKTEKGRSQLKKTKCVPFNEKQIWGTTYCLFLIDLVDDSWLVGPIVDWNRSFLYQDIRVYWFRWEWNLM
jgi:hypothetical protein